MVFSEEVKKQAFENANGRCEACGKQLVFANSGVTGGRGSWIAMYRVPVSKGGTDTLENCKIVCSKCHREPPKLPTVKKTSDSDIFG
ncbi:MAG TPA: HNH endonuclease signature motif containing protein [Methanocorpusculum sp.]|jgi:5-methylcytosine-specific restriction endonuclease McrA|nr:HNH endonuclease [Bacteroidales bacterium]HJJ43815.1 HNH endonuclease signature motif containing protein [Methanocorpusculum sp.]HJJ53385.1 HNH endonuclease signature motif containing protein [Methanocorpusculum sp.]